MLLTYSSHFHNSFHFDDSHTITENPWIRDLRNIPKFFTDGTTFSSLPTNRAYRPIVTTSLALDYWLGKGLDPFWFHISNFFWFLTQIVVMFLLFRCTLGRARPASAAAPRVALFAAALYGLHPAMAETVNYIIQRADLYAALGAVAGLAAYAMAPAWRRTGLYLLPVIAAILSKPTAAVFPALLFLWILLFGGAASATAALRRSLPSLAAVIASSFLVAQMTPSTFAPGASSAWAYRISQPAVLFTYFQKFFLPAGLSADTDRIAYPTLLAPEALIGFLFVAALCAVIWFTAKRRELRPVAFGLAWFLIASLPTSAVALAEVENDHRMYFPFIGLTLAACCAGALLLERWHLSTGVKAAVCVVLLAGFALATRERNRVWNTEDSLWYDVTIKSPRNGRGLMNFGLTQMAKGNYTGALASFENAAVYVPAYHLLEINLGIAYGATGRPAEAERHFTRAMSMMPQDAQPLYFYARWLGQQNRKPEAVALLTKAIALEPDHMTSRYLLMQIYELMGDAPALRALAAQTLSRFPADATARAYMASADHLKAPAASPAEVLLEQSLADYRAGRYAACIAAAKQAVKLRPDFAEAWNNIAAGHNSLQQWDQAITAAEQAVRLNPAFQLAVNNLAWAREHKRAAAGTRF